MLSKEIKERLARLSPKRKELLLKQLRSNIRIEISSMAVNKRSDSEIFPMSFAQKRMWFHDQLAPGTSLNNIPAIIRLSGKLNKKALEESINLVIERHEVLRSKYITVDGIPAQEIRKEYKINLPIVDLPTENESKRLELGIELATKEALSPFNLAEDVLFKAKLIQIADDDYIFTVVMHHIVSDGWSVGILIEEVSKIYSNKVEGTDLELNELPIQYADYAEWQHKYLKDENLNSLLTFWKNQLKDIPEQLNLPIDKVRQKNVSFSGKHIKFIIPQDIAKKIKSFSEHEGTTLFMTLLSVFNVLLYRITGQKDICVGSPVANRDQIEVEKLIGFFVNVVVMRSLLAGDLTFDKLLHQVRETAINVYNHQQLPFEKIVEELQPKRDIAYNPIFQVLFDFQNENLNEINLPGLSVSPIELESGTVKYDLVLSFQEKSDCIEGVFGFNEGLFEEATIKRMISSFNILLEDTLLSPDKSINELQILPKDEISKIIHQWNSNKKELEFERSIVELFEQQTAETPEKIALRFVHQNRDLETLEITYSELNKRANQLARYISKLELGKEELVGLCTNRSIDMIIGLLGILKAGRAYIPIDPTYPAERIEYLVSNTGISTVVTHSNLLSFFNDDDINTISLDDSKNIFSGNSENLKVDIVKDNLAYVIYTSGSTGEPKGVMVQHKGLVNHVHNSINNFKFDKRDTILQYLSITFDAAGEEIYPSLISGATLVIPESPIDLVGSNLFDIISIEKITTLHFAAAIWHNFQDYLDQNGKLLPEHLRLIIVGGETPSLPKIKSVKENHKHKIEMFNVYGPTEATITSLYFQADNQINKLIGLGTVPVGKPLQNVSIYILDKSLNPVPIGTIGEIFIGGIGVARGYLGLPHNTANSFIPDPFSSELGARLYKTGDLGRYISDGNIIFEGRSDFQVKVRGYRIELGEIETTLINIDKIKSAAVITTSDRNNQKQIVSYIVFDDNCFIDNSEIKEQLSKKLPNFMIPSTFVVLDEIPLNSHGKIDRKSLPKIEQELSIRSTEFIEPKTALEKTLFLMWKEILQIEKIGINDNFFEIGGDSIQAATFVNRLQDRLGEYVYIVAIYDAPTISKLDDYLKQNYFNSVHKLVEGESSEELKSLNQNPSEDKLSSEDFNGIQKITWIPSEKEELNFPQEKKNKKRIVFVLSSPRSGSTLFRSMLGGNPRLFAPPELQLLNYNDLNERKNKLSGRDAFWLDGTVRALMEIHGCSVEDAQEMMTKYEGENLSIKDFYGLLQDSLGKRIFVDKTPNYALSESILNRAEKFFDDVKYIHLIRHPYGVIQSFDKAKLHVFYPPFFNKEYSYNSQQLAEIVWYNSHVNTLKFLEEIPNEKKFKVFYEDLVSRPQDIIQNVCNFLEIEYFEEMLKPQSNVKGRMTDGLNDLSKMLGDVRFHEHNGITANRANSWEEKLTRDYLCDTTWALAEQFGYKKEHVKNLLSQINKPFVSKSNLLKLEKANRLEELPLSFAQQRMWFLDQLEPGQSLYNMPAALKLNGEIDYRVFNKSFNEITKRHEILRSGIYTISGKPSLIIQEQFELDIPIQNLEDTSNNKIDELISSILHEEGQKPFTLSKIPLFRIRLLRISKNEHILIFNMHHIVSDGRSIAILINEFTKLYNAFSKNQPSPLKTLPFQYIDYAHSQKNWLESELYDEELEYWRKNLSEIPDLVTIPTDNIRPVEQSSKGKQIVFKIAPRIFDKIKKYSRKENVTNYIVILTVFKTLLYRYINEPDVVIGTPVSGRYIKEIEPLIGLFVNTLVLRTNFSGSPTFRQLIEKVNVVVKNALSHQNIPFEKLVDLIQPERNLSYSPLFQIMFVYNKSEIENISIPNLSLEPLHIDTKTAKFDITFTLAEGVDSISGTLEYNSDLYENSTMAKLLEHFQMILSNLLDNPEEKISNVEMISRDELHKIIERYQKKEFYENNKLLHEIFEEQVEGNPENIAVEFENIIYTYNEINQKANKIARYLIKKGVKPENIVGVLQERSIDYIISTLAIFKSGAAYLPLDPNYPEDRLDYLINDSKLGFIVTKNKFHHLLKENTLGIISLDEQFEEIGKEKASNLKIKFEKENLAYIIYTSGSTGLPKGVQVDYASISNHLCKMIAYYNYTSDDNVLQFAAFTFDASIEQIYAPLLAGARLILRGDDVWSTEEFTNNIKKYKLSVINPPTVYWTQLTTYWSENTETIPEGLRLVICGGDAMKSETYSLWNNLNLPNVRLLNAYGPTETTITSSIFDVPNHYETTSKSSIPIGLPLIRQYYVLDKHGNLVPPGLTGELFIGGLGVARGYLYKAALTAEYFIPNKYSGIEGDRLYKTGDKVRLLKDGNFEFIGRVDFQVKIRGFRIELGEIETVLQKYEEIKESIVVVNDAEDREKQLIGYIVLNENSNSGVNEVRKFLRSLLPEYMIPAFFVIMDSFPLTSSGKVDRKSLPIAEFTRELLEEEFVEAASKNEEILTEIWKEVLKIDQVGIKDNFFSLGGDSILAIQIIAKANQEGIKLSPKDLFQYPTIHGLAANAGLAKEIVAEQEILKGDVELTPIQHWFFSQEFENRNHWNQSIMLKVNEVLNAELLEKTIRKILEHHDVLRMRYHSENGNLQQYYTELTNEIPFEAIDLSNYNDVDKTRLLREEADRIQSEINLSKGPIFSLAYFNFGENQSNRLLIVAHHLIIDGVSWRILTEDIQTVYSQLSEGLEAKLPPKTTSFQYWSKRIKNLSSEGFIVNQIIYWNEIAKIQKSFYNGDEGEYQNNEKSAKIISCSLDEKQTKLLLKEVPQKFNTEINDVLLTALVLANSKRNGLRKLTVSLEGHGREDIFDDIDISRTVGWFTSIFPVVLDLDSTVSRVDGLKIVKEQLRKIPNNGIGYGILKYLTGESEKESDLPQLSEISFNYLGQFNKKDNVNNIFEIAQENKSLERAMENKKPFQIDISGNIIDRQFGMNWVYNSKNYTQKEMQEFVDCYIQELKAIISETTVESGGYTPSDFGDVNLDDQDLDSILSELNED